MARIKITSLGSQGIIKDVSPEDLQPEAFSDGQNVRFNAQGAVSFLGHRTVFLPAGMDLLWIKAFPPITNPLWVYANAQKVGVWDGAHTDLTRASGDYTGAETDRWQGEVFNGLGILNNGADIPQLWSQFSPNILLVDLPNWPVNLRAKFVRPFKNFLIAGHMIEGGVARPFRVRWSDPAAPGTIPSSWALDDPSKLSGERDLAMSPDYVVDGLAMGDLFMVYKEKSVWAMQPLNTGTVFATWQVLSDRGVLTRDCVQTFPGGHFVVGQDDVYVHTGQRQSDVSVVEGKMRKWLFQQISPEASAHCFTLYNREEKEVWFCFPEASAQYATLALVWNWVTRSCGIRDLPEIPFGSAGSVTAEQELDVWGGADHWADGELIAGEATVEVEAERVSPAQPAALQAGLATMAGLGQLGVPGWPVYSNPLHRYSVTIAANSGPLSLSQLPLVNDANDPVASYKNQPSLIIINFSPGVVVGGNFPIDSLQRQAALFLDQVRPNSTVFLNLNGGAVVGGGGRGGNGGAPVQPFFPEKFTWGGNGRAGYPALICDSLFPFYLKITEGNVYGGGSGGGGAGGESTGDLNGGGGGGGVGGWPGTGFGLGGTSPVVGGAGGNATSPVPYTDAVPGVAGIAGVRNAGVGSLWGAAAGDSADGVGPGDGGASSRNIVVASGSILQLVDVNELGAQQFYGSLSASIPINGYVSTVPNGQQVLGHFDVSVSGAANDREPQITVTRIGGDTNINAELVRTGGWNSRIYITSSGTNRQRQAAFRVTVKDAAARTVTAGEFTVNATHGVPLYDVNVTPASVNFFLQGPGKNNFNATEVTAFSALVVDGVGPFTYAWSTTLGNIASGQGSSAIQLSVFSGTLAMGAIANLTGTLSLTVTDLGNDGDQVSDLVPLSYIFDNTVPPVSHTGTGSIISRRATMAGVGTKTAAAVWSIDITPDSIIRSVSPGSSGQITRTFNTSVTRAITGGVGPFTTLWTTTNGTITNPTSATATHSITVGPVGPGDIEIETGNLTCTVTDTSNAQVRAQTIAMSFTVNNPGPL